MTQLLILNEANAGPLTLDAAREFLAPQDAPGRAGGIPVPDPGAPTSGYHQEPKLPQTVVSRFKEMLDEAESEDEQALALQIALGERIRQLRKEEGTEEAVEKLEQALNLLRQGRPTQARQTRGGNTMHKYLITHSGPGPPRNASRRCRLTIVISSS